MRVYPGIIMVFVVGLSNSLPASRAAEKTFGPDPKVYQETVAKAIQYLASVQAQDGSVSARIGIGPTALATLGLLRNGRGAADPQVAKGLKYLEDYVQTDGGIYSPRSRISTYETCIVIVCLQEANKDGKYDKIIRQADKFVRGGQWDESKQKEKSDVGYGGAGYGGKTRSLRRQGERRRVLLYASREQAGPRSPDSQRRPAELWLDDLFRAEKHGLCRTEEG